MENELVHIGNNNSAVQLFGGSKALSNRRSDVIEVSAFSTTPASMGEIEAALVSVRSIWPMDNARWGAVYAACMADGISLERLQYCAGKLLTTHEYGNSFTPAQLLGHDRKIVLARSIQSLRSKIKGQIEWSDIAMVEYNGERMYTILDNVNLYGLHLLAKFEEPYGNMNVVDSMKDCKAVKNRRAKFGNVLKDIVDRNLYPVEMMRDFYKYWSEIVPPGDMMRFETVWSMVNYNDDDNRINFLFNKIESWASSHGVKSAFVDSSETINRIMQRFE